MTVKIPTKKQIKELAEEMGLDLTEEDVSSYINLLTPNIEAYNVVDSMPDNLPEVKYPRSVGYEPDKNENPYNAWYVKTTVQGAAKGKLKGKTVVLKDNVMLAGVQMMNGASTLEGYIPNIDATITNRILDEGATIVGKAHCEYFCLSGGSHTNAKGPVINPHKKGYSAGGSSSGSAALLAAGEVDMAIGGDQGGSIRMPASYCGVYGMKPTHGLVPYTGIMPIEIYIDHTGPMTNNVQDNALMLEVLAGEDGYDPRQYNVKTQKYTDALQGIKGIKGMKIALIKEGFLQENAENDVNTKVKAAAQKLKSMGAIIKEISIPMHMLAPALWLPIGVEGLTQTMMYGDGYGISRPDLYVTSLMDKHRNWRNRANEMSETTKLFTMLGTYINKNHGSRYYGKAMNITRILTAEYDKVLKEYDLLLMPTTAVKAQQLPKPNASREVYVKKALEMLSNTSAFDITHHPAMAIPCGMSKGLPISMMLIGKHFDESSIYKAAHAFQEGTSWKKM